MWARHQIAFIQTAAMLFCWCKEFMVSVCHIYSDCILMFDVEFKAYIKSGRLYSNMPDLSLDILKSGMREKEMNSKPQNLTVFSKCLTNINFKKNRF